MKNQRRGFDRCNLLPCSWISMGSQTTPLKSEVKENHQLNPVGLLLKVHYTKKPMQYAAIFEGCKKINFSFKI